jgi:hypothetical protein
VLLTGPAAAAYRQSFTDPTIVSLCELAASPERFYGSYVQVRADFDTDGHHFRDLRDARCPNVRLNVGLVRLAGDPHKAFRTREEFFANVIQHDLWAVTTIDWRVVATITGGFQKYTASDGTTYDSLRPDNVSDVLVAKLP